MGTSRVVDWMKILIGCCTNEDICPHSNQSLKIFFFFAREKNIDSGLYLVKAQQCALYRRTI